MTDILVDMPSTPDDSVDEVLRQFTGEVCPTRLAIKMRYIEQLDFRTDTEETIVAKMDQSSQEIGEHRKLEAAMGHFGCFGSSSSNECGVDFTMMPHQPILRPAENRWEELQLLATEQGIHDWSAKFKAPVQKHPHLVR